MEVILRALQVAAYLHRTRRLDDFYVIPQDDPLLATALLWTPHGTLTLQGDNLVQYQNIGPLVAATKIPLSANAIDIHLPAPATPVVQSSFSKALVKRTLVYPIFPPFIPPIVTATFSTQGANTPFQDVTYEIRHNGSTYVLQTGDSLLDEHANYNEIVYRAHEDAFKVQLGPFAWRTLSGVHVAGIEIRYHVQEYLFCTLCPRYFLDYTSMPIPQGDECKKRTLIDYMKTLKWAPDPKPH